MQSHKIEPHVKPLPISNKKYRIKLLDEIKQQLDTTKSKLDNEFKRDYFAKYWRACDPFKNEKEVVAWLGNTYNVSNAWLKCYELLIHFNLLPQELAESDEFIHFDNAAFPGSFIVSTHHLVKTQRSWHNKYKWYGSSLLDANEQDKEPLEDKYKLYKNYPNNWLMHAENNGDVLVPSNQIDFCKQLGARVDLYTSDLGFDVSSDYNNQELLQAPANIGQILSGLLVLKKGGSLITKQYTTFEPITLSIMYAVASFFDEFYLCKPYSSREANSETYLVGKGFRPNVYLKHPYIQAMFDRIATKSDVPLFDAKDYDPTYLKGIVSISKQIFGNQITKIEEDIKRVAAAYAAHHRDNHNGNHRDKRNGNPSDNPIILKYNKSIENNLSKWYTDYPIFPMLNERRLRMYDAFRQF